LCNVTIMLPVNGSGSTVLRFVPVTQAGGDDCVADVWQTPREAECEPPQACDGTRSELTSPSPRSPDTISHDASNNNSNFRHSIKNNRLQVTSTAQSSKLSRTSRISPTNSRQLFEAADHGDIAALDEGVRNGLDLNHQDEEGRTPLLMAVRNGHVNVVQSLLARRVNTELATKHKATPLGLASWRGFMTIMSLLIEARASVNGTEDDPENCRPALLWAAEAGKEEAAELLLDHNADVSGCESGLHPAPLENAAKNGHTGVVRLLTGRGAVIYGRSGGEALTWSARHGHASVCEFLLTAGADPGYTDQDGIAVLMWASARGHSEVAKCLIKAQAVVDQTNEDQRTSLMFAARRGHRSVVKTLMDSGASLYLPLLQLEETGDVERLASAISTGVSMLRGISLEAFARRLSPVTAAKIIELGGHLAFQLVEGLFQDQEVILEGTHAVNNLTLAYMYLNLNVAADPVKDGPDKCFLLPRQNLSFAPQSPLPWYFHARKVDVKFLRCVLPRVWDTSVVYALSKASGVEVFQGPYAEAIVYYAWSEVWLIHAVSLSIQASLVLLLGWMAIFISDENEVMEMQDSARYVPGAATLGLSVCFGMHVPYIGISKGRATCRGCGMATHTLMYIFRVGCVLLLLVCLWEINMFSPSPALFRATAAAVSTFEWVGFLDGLTAFAVVGPAILPTLTAMRDIWVMAGVLALVLLAAIHAHVLLTRVPPGESYLIIWRLGLLGDFELEEFSGTSAWQSSFDAPIKTLLLMISFGVNLVLMNIFIGVVGNSYNDALITAKANFLRKRAKICVTHRLGPLAHWLETMNPKATTMWVCAAEGNFEWSANLF